MIFHDCGNPAVKELYFWLVGHDERVLNTFRLLPAIIFLGIFLQLIHGYGISECLDRAT